MAMASITIEAMRSLVTTIRTAGEDLRGARTAMAGELSQAGLSSSAPAPMNRVAAWCDEQLPGLVRRLSLAEALEASTPGFQGVVQIDESRLSTLTPAEAERLAADLAESLEDDQRLGEEELAVLIANAEDPYFAVALMNAVSPETLAITVMGLSGRYDYDLTNVMPVGDQTYDELRDGLTADYEAALSAFGVTLATATRSTTPSLRSGYVDDVIGVLTPSDLTETWGGRLPAAMSVVLSYGSYDAHFAERVAEAVYDYETASEDFPGSWRQVAGDHGGVTLPGGTHRTDVMAGVMAMLGHSPDAAQGFFSGGPTTTVEVDGQEMTVTERLQYLIQERTWAPGKGSDDGEGLGAALRAATTEYRNREATGRTSAELATQVFGLIADRTRENNGGLADFAWGADNGWEMWHGMRDDVAAMLADYAPDLFLVPGYGGEPSLSGDLYRDANDLFPDGLPYGALLTEHMVRQLMFTLGQEPGHVETVTDGWAVANQVFQSHWAGRTSADYPVLFLGGNGRDQLLNPLSQGAMVLDLLMDSSYDGDDADAAKAEERAKAVQRALSMASALPILKPGEAVGQWGAYLIDQAKSQATTALGEIPGRSSTDDLNVIRDQTADAAQRMFLNTLLGEGFFDESVVDGANERYPGLDLEPPPEGALLRDADGTVTGFDFDSDEFRRWAIRSAPLEDVRGAVITAFGLEPR
jgi:hypothetical protein